MYSLKLLGVCVLIFVCLLVSLGLTHKYIGMFAGFVAAFAIPFFIFWLNRKKIKRYGSAVLNYHSIVFSLDRRKEYVEFASIRDYLVQYYNGVSLRIRLNNGQKILIVANENFCNPDKLGSFCGLLETIFEKHKEEQKLQMIRKKSVFELRWMFVFLIVITVILIGVIVAMIVRGSFQDVKPYVYLFSSSGSLIALWSGYYMNRHRKRN